MSDHDKVELIAAAQVQVIGGSPGSITFSSNQGFDTASRGSAGVYELQLDHKHDDHKLVVNVTRKSSTTGEIQAEIENLYGLIEQDTSVLERSDRGEFATNGETDESQEETETDEQSA